MCHYSWDVNVGLLWFMAEWRSSALHTVWFISLFLNVIFITYQLYKCKGSSNSVTQACPLQQPELPVQRCCTYIASNWDISKIARCYFYVWSHVSVQGTMAGGFGVKPGFCNTLQDTADLPAGMIGFTLQYRLCSNFPLHVLAQHSDD